MRRRNGDTASRTVSREKADGGCDQRRERSLVLLRTYAANRELAAPYARGERPTPARKKDSRGRDRSAAGRPSGAAEEDWCTYVYTWGPERAVLFARRITIPARRVPARLRRTGNYCWCY